MLAQTDSGLAYLVLAAARVAPHARDRWLQRVAQNGSATYDGGWRALGYGRS